jgi:ABC-type nitrate/sulfonate/bicarbonate transport system substrate-binding protein
MRLKITIGFIIIAGIVFAGYYILKNGTSGEYKSSFTGPVEKVTLAAYEGEASLLAYVAEEYGLFDENGLDVTITNFDSGKAAADDLIDGNADIATSAVAVFVNNGFNDPDLKVLSTIATLDIQGLIARKDKGISSPSDLAGKKIGVTKKSQGEFNLGIFLLYNEVSLDDVELINLGPKEIIDLLISGEIDAGFSWEPNLYIAKNKLGDNALVWKTNVPSFDFILLSKDEWLDKNPDVVKRFMASIVQAEDYVKQHNGRSLTFMKEKFKYDQDYALSIWDDHVYLVGLSQALIISFENLARWAITHNITTSTQIPNYLERIYFDALTAVKPTAVTIVR